MDLLDRGWSLKEVARRVGASFSAVYRWQQAVRRHGLGGPKVQASAGRPRELQDAGCRRPLDRLLQGAGTYGFPNGLWTLKRIRTVIRKEFGVVYHPHHVW